MSGSFTTQATLNASRVVSGSTRASERERPLREDHRQTLPLCSSVPGGSFATIGASPPYIFSTVDPALLSQFSTRSFAPSSHHVSYPSYATDAAKAECPECCQLDDGRPCVHYAERETVLDVTRVPQVQIGVKQEVPRAGHARNGPLLSHCDRAEEELGPLSPSILHDANLLLSTPNVADESVLYNRNWTESDILNFIRILIEESEITCQCGPCGDQLKVKEIKDHLIHSHDFKSNPKPYNCPWNGCSSGRQMTELSSLVRHIQEHHRSAYRHWPCPTCERRFSREETLLKHFKRCLGRKMR